MKGARAAAVIKRFHAQLNALRLSTLGAMFLALLATVDLTAVIFTIGAMKGADLEAGPPKMDWHPPTLLSRTIGNAKAASDDTETLSRPIFWKSRRAAVASTQDRPDQGRARTSVRSLVGVSLEAIVEIRKAGRAFIVSNGVPGGQWLARGEKVDGWTISEISELELTLIDGEQSARLPLYPEFPRQ